MIHLLIRLYYPPLHNYKLSWIIESSLEVKNTLQIFVSNSVLLLSSMAQIFKLVISQMSHSYLKHNVLKINCISLHHPGQNLFLLMFNGLGGKEKPIQQLEITFNYYEQPTCTIIPSYTIKLFPSTPSVSIIIHPIRFIDLTINSQQASAVDRGQDLRAE